MDRGQVIAMKICVSFFLERERNENKCVVVKLSI